MAVIVFEAGMGQQGTGLSCSANCRRARKVMRQRGCVTEDVQEGAVYECIELLEYWDPALRKKEWRTHPPRHPWSGPRSHGCRRAAAADIETYTAHQIETSIAVFPVDSRTVIEPRGAHTASIWPIEGSRGVIEACDSDITCYGG